MWLGLLAGCQMPDWQPVRKMLPGLWHTDYLSAEKDAAGAGRPLLIYFKDAQPWAPDPVHELLKDSPIRTEGCVKCVLLRSYEPDRRYVRQFGVDRAPAVILVHPDGTYHSLTGDIAAEQLERFFVEGKPPGRVPVRDPLLPRPAVYAWQTDLGEAREEANRSNRVMLVVLDRPWSRDWERLSPMLQRPEVFSRVREMVHCRPTSTWSLAQPPSDQFQVQGLPAVVLVRPNGALAVLEMPNSYEAIVRFLDGTNTPAEGGDTAAVSSSRLLGAPAQTAGRTP